MISKTDTPQTCLHFNALPTAQNYVTTVLLHQPEKLKKKKTSPVFD